MSDDQFVLYESFDEGRIARVLLNRPDAPQVNEDEFPTATADAGVPNGRKPPIVRVAKDRVRADS